MFCTALIKCSVNFIFWFMGFLCFKTVPWTGWTVERRRRKNLQICFILKAPDWHMSGCKFLGRFVVYVLVTNTQPKVMCNQNHIPDLSTIKSTPSPRCSRLHASFCEDKLSTWRQTPSILWHEGHMLIVLIITRISAECNQGHLLKETHLLDLLIQTACSPPTGADTWHLKSTQA